MGSWRKVGAFLGLVPDESQHYDGDGYEGGGYEGNGYNTPGYDTADYRSADYGTAQYQNAGYDGGGYGRQERGPFSGATPSNDADSRGDYVAGRTTGAHPAGAYRPGGEDGVPAPGGSSSARSARRFSTEPVTQGALAMKGDKRRDADPSSAARPASVKLTGFGEARIVGEKYRDGHSVILDMTEMSDADARRLVDFSAGLAFSLRGSIEKVAPKVFMLLPAEADIAGGAASALEDARAYVGAYAQR